MKKRSHPFLTGWPIATYTSFPQENHTAMDPEPSHWNLHVFSKLLLLQTVSTFTWSLFCPHTPETKPNSILWPAVSKPPCWQCSDINSHSLSIHRGEGKTSKCPYAVTKMDRHSVAEQNPTSLDKHEASSSPDCLPAELEFGLCSSIFEDHHPWHLYTLVPCHGTRVRVL